MLVINERLGVPLAEFSWTFVRAGGPGGQNVNKVASKAVLRWDVAGSPSVPDDVKARLRLRLPRRITREGVLVLASQRYRDQDRNRQDCLEKLREFLVEAAVVPKARKKTGPTRGSRERRLSTKRHRSAAKQSRRTPSGE